MSPRIHLSHPAEESDPDYWSPQTVEDGDENHEDEQLGTKEKFWVVRSQDARPWLFKLARGVGASTRGEDWAEWVVHKIAQALEVPSAIVVPAALGDRRGILARSFVDVENGERLVHGNERLAESDPSYDAATTGENSRYTVAAVEAALRGVGAPVGAPAWMTAFDAWAGFVTLDALVAGRDRHHANWGVIRSPTSVVLAPTFDHGNALGFQESDARRERLLADPEGFERWLERGTSRHFAGRPSLLNIAREAQHLAAADTRRHWRSRVAALSPASVDTIVASIPREVMSDAARRFATAIVRNNRRRLLDDDSDRG